MFKISTSNPASAGARPHSRRIPNAIGIVLIVASLALVGITLRSAFRADDVNRTPPLAVLVNPSEIRQREDALAGVFATGDDEGDRAIVIDVGGKIRLQVLGPRETVRIETAGTYRLGRRDRKLYLAVANGGEIEAANRDTLVYYRDTYRRTR